MLKIGITGGIGSGKTTVCQIFETLGVPVFYADKEAKKLMSNNVEVIVAVKNTFGNESYLKNGDLNRPYLAQLVFNDEQKLTLLNEIVHPATFAAFDAWVKLKAKHAKYILKEAALLFESESYKRCDKTVLVLADEQIKLNRVTKRDGIGEVEVRLRMDKQWTDAQKMKMADFFIDNNENKSLINQVWALHQLFSK